MSFALFDAVFLACFALVFLAVARQVLRSQAYGQPFVKHPDVNTSAFQHHPFTFAINGPRSAATFGRCPSASAADWADDEIFRGMHETMEHRP